MRFAVLMVFWLLAFHLGKRHGDAVPERWLAGAFVAVLAIGFAPLVLRLRQRSRRDMAPISRRW